VEARFLPDEVIRILRERARSTGDREVPGLHFVVRATMGLTHYSCRAVRALVGHRRITRSLYTCALAYWIGRAMVDYPVASVGISGLLTTAVAYLGYRRTRTE
jgi:hypothetical protein